MSRLWENNFWYTLLRPYVDFCTRRSYSRLRVEGRLPEDGRAVIIAPNHTGTLMDALVVLQLRRGATAFGARADIFRRPAAARALEFLKILPIARKRDGLRSVAQNLEIMPRILEVLEHGVPFCIFPEGRHRPMHSLLPIHKGVGRIALRSQERVPTCIVPVGIDYSDFFRYRGSCTVRIGEPLDMGAWLEANPGLHPSESAAKIGAELAERLKKLILYIPDDENYEARLKELLPVPPRRWWHIPAAVLGLPFFLLSALLTLPQWGIAEYICRRKLADKAFSNSVRFLLRLVGTPVMLLLWALAGFLLLLPLAAAALLLYYLFSYSIFYDYLRLLRSFL